MTTYINTGILVKVLANVFFGISMLAGISSGSVMTSVCAAEQYQTSQVAAEKSVTKQTRHTDFLMDKGFIFRRAKKAERAMRQERTTVCLTTNHLGGSTKITVQMDQANSLIIRIASI
ncbi:hypothetical protein GCM10023189_02560 [Nibrella saemangeumensis]|uniref:Uncharacterized protein n=1 Tax=Nibrella saemangeumensis TaxID=1084526 RepID=A0ABP8MB03_9BACT